VRRFATSGRAAFVLNAVAGFHHLLANDFFKKGMAATERAEKRVQFENAAQQIAASLNDFPQGFIQDVATKVLQSRVDEELKKIGEP
jgi:hypothetical protein